MAMNHAREIEADIEIACERDGTIIGLRGDVHTDMGAYMRTNGAVGARNIAQFMGGPYRVPHVKIDSLLWMTNKTPVGTYRGPGRFEGSFFIERLLDMVAHDLGIDRVELRRRNLIASAEQPYEIATVQPTDAQGSVRQRRLSADARSLPEGVRLDREGEAARQADRRPLSRPRGRLLRRGRRGRPEGKRAARGQSPTAPSRCSWARRRSGRASRRCSRRSPPTRSKSRSTASAHVHHGSTTTVSDGYGAYHSRSVVMGGSALLDAAEKFQAAIREAAANASSAVAPRR